MLTDALATTVHDSQVAPGRRARPAHIFCGILYISALVNVSRRVANEECAVRRLTDGVTESAAIMPQTPINIDLRPRSCPYAYEGGPRFAWDRDLGLGNRVEQRGTERHSDSPLSTPRHRLSGHQRWLASRAMSTVSSTPTMSAMLTVFHLHVCRPCPTHPAGWSCDSRELLVLYSFAGLAELTLYTISCCLTSNPCFRASWPVLTRNLMSCYPTQKSESTAWRRVSKRFLWASILSKAIRCTLSFKMLSLCCLIDPYCLSSVLIGELDEAADQAVDLSTIRAEPLPPIRY